MSNKNIIAGPFLGEFGWELMRWQGMFRKLALDGWSVYMISREGHQAIYNDYVKEFISADSLRFKTKGSTDGWRLDGCTHTLTVDHRNSICPGAKYVSGIVCIQTYAQEFIKFGNGTHNKYDLVIHPRSTKKGGTGIRNWNIDDWQILLWELQQKRPNMKIACVGSIDGAEFPKDIDNCEDFRGAPLDKTIEVISNSRLVIGPSSGPMHLASLCGTTHIVWTDNKFWGSCNGTNRQRYETNWNPLQTKCIILDEDNWQPPVLKVKKTIEDYFGQNN